MIAGRTKAAAPGGTAVGLVVAVVAFLRATPHLVWEEGPAFWERVPTMSPLAYLVEPWAGYVQVPARAAFLLAYHLDSVLFTRLWGAVVIGLVAAFLTSDRLAPAIPDRRVRLAFGLSLALLPITEPYVGPLNAQWWLALYAVGLSLTTDTRRSDYLGLALAGLSGVAACLALPLFRDRRGLVLLGASAVQSWVLLGAERRPGGFGVSLEFALVLAVLALALVLSRLPRRTRLAFGYLGAVTILAGSFTIAGAEGGWRYLTPAWACIALVLAYVPTRYISKWVPSPALPERVSRVPPESW